MAKWHIDTWRTEKCWRCAAQAIDGSCLIINQGKKPPQCKDGTCNLRKIGYYGTKRKFVKGTE